MTTHVAMPPVISMSSEEEDVAFKVLNQDNLPITIIGEGILKPATEKQKGIVYPTRRVIDVSNLEDNQQRSFTRSNGFINGNNNNNNNQERNGLRKNYSVSHGNLNHVNSASKTGHKLAQEAPSHNQHFDSKFSRALDAKLRKLQKEEKQQLNQINQGHQQQPHNRKPFVTTVKKGEFLEPPPEIASLIGIKVEEPKIKEVKQLVYAYASQPRVLNRSNVVVPHKYRCDAAAKAAACVASNILGIHHQHQPYQTADVNSNFSKGGVVDVPLPYANLMFDKRVCRGSNFAPHLSGHMGDGESAAARAAEARRRALARRKAKNQQIRAAQLRLGSPPPVPGRKHEPVQTDTYLEEIFNNPPVEDMCTQTDLFLERPVSPFFVPQKSGVDVETQIYPGDLFDFDMEVQPILEVLVGKTIEQALIEVLEEEELAALREQQRRFLELRAVETGEMQRVEEREKRFRKEKERRMREHEQGMETRRELEERIAAAVLMQGYMADLLPSVLEGLESEGFLIDQIKECVDEEFMPWLMKEVTHELKDMVSSRDVLTDIVREILENRAEIYKALNQEPLSQESEEEGPTQEDIILQDHMKLQDEIMKKTADSEENPPQI